MYILIGVVVGIEWSWKERLETEKDAVSRLQVASGVNEHFPEVKELYGETRNTVKPMWNVKKYKKSRAASWRVHYRAESEIS